jgi:hypothetical protein
MLFGFCILGTDVEIEASGKDRMRILVRFIAALVAGLLLAQCGKDKGGTSTQGQLPYGLSVELLPVNLPEPPAGMVYQAWVLRLEKSGTDYSLKYFPFQKMDWVGYPFHFVDPTTGADLGYVFRASPDTANLFTQNMTGFVRADTIQMILETLLRGQTVPLSGSGINLSGLVAFLFSIEPLVDPDTALPATPFLVAYSNDSGKTEMIFPYNFRHPDFIPSYFMASPTDTLFNEKKETNEAHHDNEHQGVWFGFIDTSRYDLGIRMALPDTVLRKLGRELLPGWQFEGWVERGGTRVSTGHFLRGDSADLQNLYAVNPDSVFSIPGEDLLNNPPPEFEDTVKGVLNSTVMITLEPLPDNDPAQFPMVLFRAFTPAEDSSFRQTPDGPDLASNIHFNFEMENRARFFPKIRLRVIPQAR